MLWRIQSFVERIGPVWLMQPIPYLGEKINSGWIYEPKIDGWRLQVIRQPDGEIEFWGRRLEKKPNWTKKLTAVSKVAKKFMTKGTILDCELTSNRGRRFVPSVFAKKPKAKPIIPVFDIIYKDGSFVGDLSLEDRKKILSAHRIAEPFIMIPYYPVTNLGKHLETTVMNGAEGIVIKRLDSIYEVGRDGPIATHLWRKIKP